MEGLNLKIVLIGILVASQITFGCPHFLHHNGAGIAFVHHFFHANIFHLAVNCLSLWSLFRKEVRYSMVPLITAYLLGSASWFFTSADVVGFSNIIFALIGLRRAHEANHQNDDQQQAEVHQRTLQSPESILFLQTE